MFSSLTVGNNRKIVTFQWDTIVEVGKGSSKSTRNIRNRGEFFATNKISLLNPNTTIN